MFAQQRDRSAVASFAHPELPDVYAAVLLFALAVPPTLFLFIVRPPLLLPLASVVSLACAAAVALAAIDESFVVSLENSVGRVGCRTEMR